MEKIAQLYRRWSERNGWEGDDGEWRGRLDGREATLRPGIDSIQPGGVELSVVVNHTEQPRLLTPLERGSTEVDHALAPFLDRDELQSIALFSEGVRVRFVPLTRPELVEEQTRRIVQTVVDHVATYPYR